jgi:ER membrane protein complex subunit 3
MPHELQLDPQIRDWVLVPIMVVMVLIGVLRHYLTLLISSGGGGKPQKAQKFREG